MSRLPPRSLVGDNVPDGLDGVSLGVANQANRASLDPTGGVYAGYVAIRFVEHASLLVFNDAEPLVEGNLR